MHLFPKADETICDVSRTLRAAEMTCIDVLKRCLDRIDEHESAIQAWVSIDRDGALNQAQKLDAELAAGTCRGPLHGIPVGIKDIIDVAGVPTAAGSAEMSRKTAAADARLVANLRAAGAVILGKTVTTQFACFDPPPTKNPWNPAHTPGGSSSGSAAAVATGMCLGAVGSQTGGSITRPASFCGVAGCKATFGKVSMHGVVPVALSLDHPGPIARSVRDLAILLDAMTGDSTPGSEPPSQIADLGMDDLVPPTLGRLGGLFDERADDSARDAVDSAVSTWLAAGAAMTNPVLPAEFDGLLSSHKTIMAAEMAASHEGRLAELPDDYLPGVRSLIEEGLSVSAAEYVRCRQHQDRTRAEVLACFDEADVLVCPATIGTAPDVTTTGDPSFNAPWSYTGLPTVSFPVGQVENGLPLAVQLVGRPFAEVPLFRAALWCEETLRRSFGEP